MHRYTKESRGFAFIRYYDKRDAEDAMDGMDGKMLDGRELRVQMARCCILYRCYRPTNVITFEETRQSGSQKLVSQFVCRIGHHPLVYFADNSLSANYILYCLKIWKACRTTAETP